jgi:hypothetical protein
MRRAAVLGEILTLGERWCPENNVYCNPQDLTTFYVKKLTLFLDEPRTLYNILLRNPHFQKKAI